MSDQIARLPSDDPRISRGLFTLTDAAGWLDVPRTTFRSWAVGSEKQRADEPAIVARPIILTVPSRRGEPGVPFLGLAEGWS